ncbi:hypothetical protein [Leadbettera azotonutricia]|uniref:Uncharacterized protein n=1 Tax=Leadbettera azotonutricia (strain ATCC BAA-888 / DSM 13862 / ZAS-9) TaxID=545695 RepID=F5Y6N7_LEAAZ|nr:hypothetical protein [Leadbettera azotonutricia]AEF82445.1 hypothetical protein TREAZ_1233 [Leadbettera azotonutricia ZAS-9]
MLKGNPDFNSIIDIESIEELSENYESVCSDIIKSKIKLEYDALNYYINGNDANITENAVWLSQFCSVDKETAIVYRNTLSQIMEIIYNNKDKPIYDVLYILNNYDNENILKYFEAGSYFRIDFGYSYTDAFISGLLIEKEKIEHYLQVYQTALPFSTWYIKNKLAKEYINLIEFYNFYNIKINDDIIPDNFELFEFFDNSKNKIELISNYSEALDKTFDILPEWIYLQKESWMDSFLQLLTIPPEELQNNLKEVQRTADILNTSFKIYKNSLVNNEVIEDYNGIISNYNTTDNKLRDNLVKENFLLEEIKGIRKNMEILDSGESVINKRIEDITKEIGFEKDKYEDLYNEYKLAAQNIIEAGNNYDEKYKNSIKYYDILELKRQDYEKQEAIKRWAETAYLDIDSAIDELNGVKNKYERSEIILEALQDIYNNKESKYINKEYESLYIQYKEIFSKLFISLRVMEVLNIEIEKEKIQNSEIYSEYLKLLNRLNGDLHYVYPDNFEKEKTEWNIYDIIKVAEGKLKFAFTENFTLDGNNMNNAKDLLEYITMSKIDSYGVNNTTQLEVALRDLNNRLSVYFSDNNKYEQWGLARDYLIRSIIESNGNIPLFDNWYNKADIFDAKSQIGRLGVYPVLPGMAIPISSYAFRYLVITEIDTQVKAYNNLGAKEKEDLEFFTLLTLLNGGYKKSGFFERISEAVEYREVYMDISIMHRILSFINSRPSIRKFKAEDREIVNTLNKLSPVLTELESRINECKTYLKDNLKDFDLVLNKYNKSSNRLKIFMGNIEKQEFTWTDIENALLLTGKVNEKDILNLQKYWNEFTAICDSDFNTIPEILANVIAYYKESKENYKNNLEELFYENLSNVHSIETEYKKEYDLYINGDTDLNQLLNLAKNMYDENSLEIKTHLENMIIPIINQMGVYIDEFGLSRGEYNQLSSEYITLLERAYKERFNAELMTREVQWGQQRLDILEKYNSWVNDSVLILENGRNSWKDNNLKLYEKYNQWLKDFKGEYHKVDEAWDFAYLESLKDKELWINQSYEAADKASSDALLLLIGSDAESKARAMYTRDPVYYSDYNYGNLESIMEQFLFNTGIVDLKGIINSATGKTEILHYYQKNGLYGGDIWSQSMIDAEAYILAKNVREEILSRETIKMAFNVQDMAKIAISELEEAIKNSNRNFQDQIDDIFILDGHWQKFGHFYGKEVIVHSTLITRMITENAFVEGYTNLIINPVHLQTDISENKLRGLDTFAIQIIIDSMYSEINALYNEYFFDAKGMDNPRFTSFGKFGLHIGYIPEQKKSDVKLDEGKSGVFEDYGYGEFGRLMSEYIFWSYKEEVGINSMALANYDKPMWDSRGSVFQAPSLRTAADVGLQVITSVGALATAVPSGGSSILGAIALNSLINTSDEILFNLMDVAGGMKFKDSLSNIGKAYTMNFAAAALGSVFGGVKGVETGFFKNGLTGNFVDLVTPNIGKTAVKIASTGLQNLTIGTANSLLGAISYEGNGNWNFDDNYMVQSLKNSGKSAIVTVSGMAISDVLNIGIEGFVKELSDNGRKLNATLGGLAGQGINYALGNDFTINLLNLDMFSKSDNINAGLLEMHFGQDGTYMQIGMGGVDLGAKSFVSSVKGLEAWKVNGQLLFSSNAQVKKYASQMRTLYSDAEQTRQEYDNFLIGKTKIVEDNRDYTQSIYNETTGIKTIYLGTDAQNDGSRFGLNVILAHEAYRDGIIGNKAQQKFETQNAVIGHMETASAILNTYGYGLGLNATLEGFIYDYLLKTDNIGGIANYAGMYDSSADYWKLLNNGNLMYDGFATLRDEEGNIIRSAKSMGVSDTAIESALLKILGFDSPTKEMTNAVRQLMVYSGLVHSNSENSDEWYWQGDREVRFGDNLDNYYTAYTNINELNEGAIVYLSSIYSLYNNLQVDKKVISSFISKTYGSSVSFINHAEIGDNLKIAREMLSEIYDYKQLQMIGYNKGLFAQSLLDGINLDSMVDGIANRSQGFEATLGPQKLKSSSIPNADTLEEDHTGIDYGPGGKNVYVPGGYWKLIDTFKDKAYFQLYGSDLKMKIQHLNPDEVKKLVLGSFFGINNNNIISYPTESYGSGTNAHIHIDMTMSLPYNGYYTRQFVDPDTLKIGNKFDYKLIYKNYKGDIIPDAPTQYYRY